MPTMIIEKRVTTYHPAFTNNGIHQCNYHIVLHAVKALPQNISITPVDRIKDGYPKNASKRPNPATLPGVFNIGSKP